MKRAKVARNILPAINLPDPGWNLNDTRATETDLSA